MKRLMGLLIVVLAACGTPDEEGDGGPAFDATGTYALTYERISRSDTCVTRDIDFIDGLLLVTHDGGKITLDFGSGRAISGLVNKDGVFTVGGTFDESGEGLTLTSVGVITDTDIASDVDTDPAHETIGDFDFDADPEPDCRVRGKLTGPKSTS